jgi:MFS family permease
MASVVPPPTPVRVLLAHRGFWHWSASAFMVRLPPLMVPLAFVLVGTYASGSQAVGGLMVTVYILSEVCCAPLAGRLLDRLGPAAGVPRVLGLAVVVWCGLALASTLRAPAPVLFLMVALAAALGAGAPGAMRALLSQTVLPQLVAPAVALDAIAVELVVVTAPLLVALTAAPSPPGVIIAMAAATAIAAVLVCGQRRPVPATPAPAVPGAPAAIGRRALWRNRRFAFWIAVGVMLGYAIGTAEIGALPRALRLGGGPREAAALIAVLGISSALSGLVYANVAHRFGLGAMGRASILLGGLVVGTVELGLSANWAMAAGAMVTLGLCCSPLGTVQSQAAEADAPAERQAEAFGILYASSGVGYALGGLCLALLPLRGILLLGAAIALLALMLVPKPGRHSAFIDGKQ